MFACGWTDEKRIARELRGIGCSSRRGGVGVQKIADGGNTFRRADKDDDVAAVQLGVGAGREQCVLLPPDGDDGGAGGLPEAEAADGAADLVRVRRDGDLIVRQAAFRGERQLLRAEKPVGDRMHPPAKLLVLREQTAKLRVQCVLFRPAAEGIQIAPRIVG